MLDRSGTIVAVNAAWTRYAQSNGGDGSGTSVGINYLEASCAPTTVDPFALAAREGITQVLAGARPSFAMEYPCHAPDEERWFVLDARPLDGANGFAILHPDDVEIARRAMADIVTIPTGTACHEVRMRHRDGSWRWTEATLTNLLDVPDVGGLVVNVRDITERKAATVTIAERAESFSTLFHGTAEAMTIHDGQVFVAVNRAYADLIGLDAEQLGGRALLDFVAPVSRALAIDRMRQGSEVPYDLIARRVDG